MAEGKIRAERICAGHGKKVGLIAQFAYLTVFPYLFWWTENTRKRGCYIIAGKVQNKLNPLGRWPVGRQGELYTGQDYGYNFKKDITMLELKKHFVGKFRAKAYMKEEFSATTITACSVVWGTIDQALKRLLNTGLYTGGQIEEYVDGIGWVVYSEDK